MTRRVRVFDSNVQGSDQFGSLYTAASVKPRSRVSSQLVTAGRILIGWQCLYRSCAESDPGESEMFRAVSVIGVCLSAGVIFEKYYTRLGACEEILGPHCMLG